MADPSPPRRGFALGSNGPTAVLAGDLRVGDRIDGHPITETFPADERGYVTTWRNGMVSQYPPGCLVVVEPAR